jgi:zinc D-Ala-D-Ala dipeptidase
MMEKDDYFQILENTFLTYADLKTVEAIDNGEAMVSLNGSGISFTVTDGLPPSTGNEIYLREGLIERLIKAQEIVADLFDGGVLDVIYGYRSLNVQTTKYQEIKAQLQSKYTNDDELNEAVHRFIAVPDVAGHPSGGAVDVRILGSNGNEIDMGTQTHDLTKDSYVFNPFISKTAWLNRQKLRQAMTAAGFAPFDGEWWHFSYGDREWAAYYNKPYAIYNQIEFSG